VDSSFIIDRRDCMLHHPGNNPSWRRLNIMRKVSWLFVAAVMFISSCLVASNGSWAKDVKKEALQSMQLSAPLTPPTGDPNVNQALLDLDQKIREFQRERQKLHEVQRRRQLTFQSQMLDIDDKTNELNLERQKIEKELRRQQLNLQIQQLEFEQKTQDLNQERQKLQREQNRQNLKDQIEMLDFDMKTQELQQKRQELQSQLRCQPLKGQTDLSPKQER
jgi:DNA repair exonuclease SbcCD ATPase subunit